MTVHIIARSFLVVLVCLFVGVIRAETRTDRGHLPLDHFLLGSAEIDSIDDEDLLDTIVTPTFGEFTIHGGLSVPVGMFAATSGTARGFALPGPSIGLDYAIYADSIHLSPRWVSSVILTRNASDVTAVRQAFIEQFELPDEAQIEAGPWYSLTAMTGFEYKFLISQGIRIAGIGQFGFGVSKGPDLVLASENSALSKKLNVAAAPAFNVGVSISIRDRYSIGIRYKNLRIIYDLTIIQPDNQQEVKSYEQSMNSFYFFAGYVL